MAVALVRTKMAFPRSRTELVSRPRLTEGLRQAEDAGVRPGGRVGIEVGEGHRAQPTAPGAEWLAFAVFWLWNMYIVVRGSESIKFLEVIKKAIG